MTSQFDPTNASAQGTTGATTTASAAISAAVSDTFNASKRRSDAIRADLPVHPEKYTMLTGDRPTGRLLSLIHI